MKKWLLRLWLLRIIGYSSHGYSSQNVYSDGHLRYLRNFWDILEKCVFSVNSGDYYKEHMDYYKEPSKSPWTLCCYGAMGMKLLFHLPWNWKVSKFKVFTKFSAFWNFEGCARAWSTIDIEMILYQLSSDMDLSGGILMTPETSMQYQWKSVLRSLAKMCLTLQKTRFKAEILGSNSVWIYPSSHILFVLLCMY